jgi:hypothetical protein
MGRLRGKAAEHLDDDLYLADVGEELVAETLSS